MVKKKILDPMIPGGMSGGMMGNIQMVIGKTFIFYEPYYRYIGFEHSYDMICSENIGSVIRQVNWLLMKKLMHVVDVECTFVESKLIFLSRFKLHPIGDTPNGILLTTFLFPKISMVRLFVVTQCSIIHHEKTVAIRKTDVAKILVDVERNTVSRKANVSMEKTNKLLI